MGQNAGCCGCSNDCGGVRATELDAESDLKPKPKPPQLAARPQVDSARRENKLAALELDGEEDQDAEEAFYDTPQANSIGAEAKNSHRQHGEDTDVPPTAAPTKAAKTGLPNTDPVIASLLDQVTRVTDCSLKVAFSRLKVEYEAQKNVWQSLALTAAVRGTDEAVEKQKELMAIIERSLLPQDSDVAEKSGQLLVDTASEHANFSDSMCKALQQLEQALTTCRSRRRLRTILQCTQRGETDQVLELAPKSLDEVESFLRQCDLKNNKPKAQLRKLLEDVAVQR